MQRRGPRFDVVEQLLDYQQVWSLITPAPVALSDGPPQLLETDLRAWFVRHRGAVAARESFVKLEITGISKTVTHIEAIEAIVQREGAYTGSHIEHPPGGAFEVENVYLDLDRPQRGALVDRWPEDQPPTTPYFQGKAIALGQQESTTIMVRAGTATSLCRWQLKVTYRIGARRRATWTSPQAWTVSAVNRAAQRLVWTWWDDHDAHLEPHPDGLD